LDALPDNAFVDDKIIIHKLATNNSEPEEEPEKEHEDNDDDNDKDNNKDNDEVPEVGAVPDLRTKNDEVTKIRSRLSINSDRQIGRQPRRLPSMSMPTARLTPISEFNKAHPLLSWAFLSLFPRGHTKYVTSRLQDVDYKTYVKHLLLHKSGRFAQHPRFRYVVFNTLMRTQVNTRSSFFVRKLHPEQRQLSLNNLKAAFEDDSEQSEDIINSITRYAGSLRGTRPY
jgi:hypothetical protein